ncbi:receptor-like serine/threonine-protein kinase SD1-8 [Carex littledalei]|uniref:Receptor-like serine/threonine-protein kinase SD1-8 n=1 Tax=Carex littledalei TaxID=544730 RepID=A0A833QIV4_9POAL|nr:receptor-like serine/threonine-protein kinase SD1-8 [Carex littledalei]
MMYLQRKNLSSFMVNHVRKQHRSIAFKRSINANNNNVSSTRETIMEAARCLSAKYHPLCSAQLGVEVEAIMEIARCLSAKHHLCLYENFISLFHFSLLGRQLVVVVEEIDASNTTEKKKEKNVAIVVICVILGFLILASFGYVIIQRILRKKSRHRQTSMESIRSLALDRGEVINEGSRSKGNLSSLPMYDANTDTYKTEVIIDKAKSCGLDWQKRFGIIKGIARGVLYLHQDSRLRIIHRDLKASNVLLDENMNPKISDFGLARIFSTDEMKSHTNRVVGTYGYMAPEYAMHGIFSVKSDVFSFGVLVLEIISGKKNRRTFDVEPSLNLLNYAWTLWKDGKAFELLDTSISEKSNHHREEIVRCVQVGLLCVQDRPDDRPHMSEVVLMLKSRDAVVPQPKQPAAFSDRVTSDIESSCCTVCDTTLTIVEPR